MASDSSYEFDLAGAVVAVPGRLLSRAILLWISYVGLVGITAWTSWNTQRMLDQVSEDVCATAEVVIANEIYTLAVFGEQEGVNPDIVREALDVYLSIGEAVEQRCGSIFLDEIDFSD